MKSAIITPVSGRATHLRRQFGALARSSIPPDIHVVVTMNDPETADQVAAHTSVHVEQISGPDHRLPVAAARNLGADTAIGLGAELLVFLDVDCLPTDSMLERYLTAAALHPDGGIFCGPVTYLPPAGPGGYQLDRLDTYVDPHRARPVPEPGDIVETDDHVLFWSLSFAVHPSTWRRIGGFFTGYTGYGAEDTDFAQQAARLGYPMYWVGGAHALHQHHPVSDPPVEHLEDILTNGSLFHERWGWWPMQGWLDDFERLGLITMKHGVPERSQPN